MTLKVNLFGGSHVEKSTLVAHAMAELRWEGVRCGVYGFTLDYDPEAVFVVVPPFTAIDEARVRGMAEGALNFLVLRRRDYPFSGARTREAWEALDAGIEEALRRCEVRYKRLPGVRASVPYIMLKVRERLGVKR